MFFFLIYYFVYSFFFFVFVLLNNINIFRASYYRYARAKSALNSFFIVKFNLSLQSLSRFFFIVALFHIYVLLYTVIWYWLSCVYNKIALHLCTFDVCVCVYFKLLASAKWFLSSVCNNRLYLKRVKKKTTKKNNKRKV